MDIGAVLMACAREALDELQGDLAGVCSIAIDHQPIVPSSGSTKKGDVISRAIITHTLPCKCNASSIARRGI